MFQKIISFSIKNKLIVFFGVLALIGGGIYSMSQLSINAVPDITNNQVQVVTVSPSLSAQEVEQFITYPVEVAMANIPMVDEIRSISKYGLSVVTIVFEDHVPVLDTRQYVQEQINTVNDEIPKQLGIPELMPITTGLGEIYQYTLGIDDAFKDHYSAMELRTIQDWIVKRQLSGIKGIVEVSSFGGFLKQYEVAINPILMAQHQLSFDDVLQALENNNQNSGGSYIEKNQTAYYVRTEGMMVNLNDIRNTLVSSNGHSPVLIKDIGTVQFGSAKRFGAMTKDGEGEAVGGITLMLKGANSSETLQLVNDRVAEIQKSLPEGVYIEPYLDRSDLVGRAINTVKTNLLEGGVIVILVLILLLGNFRAGLIVASIIPLSMMFAFIMMNIFDVSANLMSLGAIDFGIVVDGAVIIVESILHVLFVGYVGKKLSQQEMDDVVLESSKKIYKSAAFGVLIILVVFLPILSLTGIEGKTFRPMAQTVSFAILGAMILSMTYVPMMAALFLNKNIKDRVTFADKIMNFLKRLYLPLLNSSLNRPKFTIGIAVAFLAISLFIFSRMGSEFIPQLEEGDLAMQMTLPPGTSLDQSIQTSTKAERILLDNFPEVKSVVSKIGTAEVPTDPMSIELADIMIILKPKEEWVTASDRFGLIERMEEKLSVIPAADFEFTQPIQLRFNELITGAKSDIAVKIYGEDLEKLADYGHQAAGFMQQISGAADVKVEQTEGLAQWVIQYNRSKMAQYGVSVDELNRIIRAAYAGENAGVIFEGERKFELVIRLQEAFRNNIILDQLTIPTNKGELIPMSEVAKWDYREGPLQISRDDTRRRVVIGANVRDRDIAGLVEDIQTSLNQNLKLDPGYSISYGGQFETLQKARDRLSIAVPIALLLIFILLYFAFGKVKYALLIYSAVPLSAIGGVLALWLRDMPFSISAGVGFIALFGVAVLNGIVLISHLNDLKAEGEFSLREVITKGSMDRLRPVIMTAMVASLGFLPMALSTSSGAEVQKPLATVVIGGLVTATFLTLVVLPALFLLINSRKAPKAGKLMLITVLFLAGVFGTQNRASAQNVLNEPKELTELFDLVLKNHPEVLTAQMEIEKARAIKTQAFVIPSTGIAYQRGQLDGPEIDYSWNIQQPLGNIPANFRRANAAEEAVKLAEKDFLIIKKKVKADVRKAWNNWVYNQKQVEFLTQQEELLQDNRQRADEMVEAGEAGKLETLSLSAQLLAVENELLQNRKSLNEASKVIEQLCFCGGNMPEQAEDYSVFSITGSLDSLFLDQVFQIRNQQQLRMAAGKVAVSKAQYFPDAYVAYVNQSLQNVQGFQSFQIGISIPIFYNGVKGKVNELKIEQQIQQTELDWQNLRLQQQLMVAKKDYSNYRQQLEKSKNMFSELEELKEAIQQALSIGELSFYEYVQNLNGLYNIEKTALELKKELANLSINIHYLTQE
ncbi:CusA/CzcA family heavy metal efflux RND transporter [Marivirga sp. S37H4]|uniref:CusA/CzcA family heavy metal efflux RND transporter n=1 Tax=Marivirga aurantiaca TaxID=2802615 RepID=A0A935CBL3_9BACT|nr:CusA/CzcA family heavy metal efflux RND transporter [Marivirga aurantiaca]MBK6267386.1 CusA/CzcA family heavy metal efflux RND transporter [Marivirga aurantiaca]